jgi:4-amino-4-deoxy-L-arabinose transferase-like glycosyltransferase
MASLRLFKDPLFAGRVASIFAGFFGMIGIYFATSELFKSRRAGCIASLLYILCPFTLVYDRMALYDTATAAFSVWNLFLGILLVRSLGLDIALILGLMLGVGMLNKTSGFLSLYFLPFTLLLFDFQKPKWTLRLGRWIALAFVSACLSQVVYSVLRLSPYFYIISQKDALFVYRWGEWLTHPFRFFYGNLHGEFDWAIGYMTLPIFLLAIIYGIIPSKEFREKVFLLFWWFAPFAGLALFGKVLYPRFILFMVMPLVILAARGSVFLYEKIKPSFLWLILFLFCVLPSLRTDYLLLFDVTKATIPQSDRGQYINDWPSGWGAREITAIIDTKAKGGAVHLFTEGTFGLFPYIFEIYLGDNPNVTITGLWPFPKDLPEEIAASAKIQPTYVVTNTYEDGKLWGIREKMSYPKGINQTSRMRLFEL